MTGSGLGHALIVWLLRNSAGAAIVALLVLIVQWMLGKRISARWRHNLWLLVIVRLLIPPLPTIKVPAIPHLALLRPLVRSFHALTPSATVKPVKLVRPLVIRSNALALEPTDPPPTASGAPSNDAVANVENVPHSSEWTDSLRTEDISERQAPGSMDLLLQPSPAVEAQVAPVVTRLRAKSATSPEQHIEHMAPIAWGRIAIGAWGALSLGLVLKTVLESIRVQCAVRKLRVIRDPALLELVADCSRLLKFPRAPALLEGPRESGPALVGFWRPKLLLPACVLDQFTWREVRHVVLHELVHLRRRDILINYLTSLALAVHWFNPLVWLAAARMRAERELACDEAVLALTPWREGRAYGSTIVKLLELLSRGAVPAGAMGVIGHKALMHRRIAMIARFDGSRRHWSASAILLSAAVAGAALAGAVRAQVQPQQQDQAVSSAANHPAPQEAKAADLPSTDAKPDASADEVGAQQAVRAEAERDEQTPPASTDAAPPAAKDGIWVTTETQPPAAADAAPPPGSVPTPAAAPGDVIQPRPGLAPFGGPQPGAFRPGTGFPGRPQMGAGGPGGAFAGGGGIGAAPGTIGQPQIATIEDASAVKADAKTLEKLQRPMPIQVEGESFEDVLNMLAQKGGFDILIDNRALGELNLIPNVQMNIREPQPIEQLLHFVLRQVGGDDIGFSVVHGVVVVSSKAALERHVVTRVYDVRELGNPDDMQQTIDQTIGGNTAVRFVNGKMIVTTSEPNHREIAKLLTLLRQDGPHTDATGAAPPPGQQAIVTGEEVTVYQLRHADAQDAAKKIQSKLARPGLTIAGDPRTNSVLIAGPKAEVKEAGAVIRSIDVGNDANAPRSDPNERQPANR